MLRRERFRVDFEPTPDATILQMAVRAGAGGIAKASTRTPNLDELKKAKEFGEKVTRGIPLERLRQIFGL